DGGVNWFGWERLGGILTSDPGSDAWASGQWIDVFVRGTDNALWHKWWNPVGGWSGWENLGGVLTSGPDSASCNTNHVDVFVIGTDGGLWQKGWNSTTGWTGWISRAATGPRAQEPFAAAPPAESSTCSSGAPTTRSGRCLNPAPRTDKLAGL